jgi:hypothetical protein
MPTYIKIFIVINFNVLRHVAGKCSNEIVSVFLAS